MKNKLVLSIILNVILIITLTVTFKINETKVYSFSGENDYFVIEHGEIIKNRKFEKISYSNLEIKNDVPNGVLEYKMELYFINKNEKIVVNMFAGKINPSTGASLTKGHILQNIDRIQISASGNVHRKLQDVSNKNIINNFYFEITYITYDGQEITQTLKLDVVETK